MKTMHNTGYDVHTSNLARNIAEQLPIILKDITQKNFIRQI